ncbi:nitroreductase family protein [Enterococcus sp. LJL51]|uniref:nitroreductase family protein n=1 Tax=Enterococcus sp. LJL51 TaxID=3416656 RepID=UPI003CF55CCD
MSQTMRQLIRERRTIRQTSPEELSVGEIEQILETAAYAPFHSKTEPWKVYTLQGKAAHKHYIDRILECYRRINLWKNFGPERISELEDKSREYFEKVPFSLIVTSKTTGVEKADFEAVLATAAFIQNIQLAAWEVEIGITWRTTENIFDSEFQQSIGIPEDERIVGSLQLTRLKGKKPKAKRRKELSEWVFSLGI